MPINLLLLFFIIYLTILDENFRDVQAATTENAELQLKKITNELNQLENSINTTNAKLRDSLENLKNHDIAVEKISKRQTNLRKELVLLEEIIDQIQKDQSRLNYQKKNHLIELRKHAITANRLGDGAYLQALIDDNSLHITQLSRYNEHIGRAHIEKLQEFENTSLSLDANKKRLKTQREQFKLRQAEMETTRLSLSKKRAVTNRLVQDLEVLKTKNLALKSELTTDYIRLEKLLTQITQNSASTESYKLTVEKGKLEWPLKGVIHARFGDPRDEKNIHWQGLVIQAKEGTPVKVIFSGRVVFASWLRGYGLLTIVDHGSNIMSLYGQTEAIWATVGDWVEAGEPLATAGKSGGQKYSGVYVEIREKGKPVDPLNWLGEY